MGANETGPKSLHLTELRASNFMGLKAVEVKLDESGVVQVTGPNGAGKTSFMRAIECLVGGAKVHPAQAIRRGEEEAQLLGTLKGTAGELVVERRFRRSEKGEISTVVVRGADGARYDKPQTILDALFNSTLDPEAFKSMPREKQSELLKELTGLNFGALEGKRADLYEQRTEVNRRGGDLRARFDAMAKPPADLPEEPVDVDELLKQQNQEFAIRRDNATKRSELARAADREQIAEQKVREARAEIARLRDEYEQRLANAEAGLKNATAIYDAAVKTGDELRAATAELVDPPSSDITAKISAAQATNIAIAREVDRKKVEAELDALRKKKEELTASIETLDKEKAEKIAAAKFPVEGLGLGPDGFATFNGLPFEQANHAQQLRVSTAICLARNPTMRVLGIRNGSALDSTGMKVIAEEAAKHDAQIFVERVADKGEVGIVFEDGEVVSPKPGKKAEQPDLGLTILKGGAA